MPHLKQQNHTLHYVAAGNPSHPPLLMLHGFLGSHQDFSTVLPALSHSFYCIIPDFPGHGKTLTNPDCYTFPIAAQAFVNLLDHLDIVKAHLLGYSMGGRLALYLVCQWPERFASVALESASPGLETAEQRRLRVEKDEAIARKLETLPLSDFLSQWYQNPLFDSLKNYPKQFQAMLRRRQNNRPAELACALRSLGTGRQPSLWAKLAQAECPLLLLVGEKDEKFVAIARKIMSMSSKKSDTTLAVVKDCGHNIHLESPDGYSQQVSDFIRAAIAYPPDTN